MQITNASASSALRKKIPTHLFIIMAYTLLMPEVEERGQPTSFLPSVSLEYLRKPANQPKRVFK
jgi:hypothetical protein